MSVYIVVKSQAYSFEVPIKIKCFSSRKKALNYIQKHIKEDDYAIEKNETVFEWGTTIYQLYKKPIK